MQDIKLKFSWLSCFTYCNNLLNLYQILNWVMYRLEPLDVEWPSYEALVWKEALAIYQDRVFTSFLCALSLSSAFRSFIHMYCGTGSLRWSTRASRGVWVKLLPFSRIPNIFAVNTLLKMGKIHSIYSIL